MTSSRKIYAKLYEVKSRFKLLKALKGVIEGFFIALVILALLLNISRFFPSIKISPFIFYSLPFIIILFFILIRFFQKISIYDLAFLTDSKSGLKERISTAVEMIENNKTSPIVKALIDDAAGFSEKIETEKIVFFTFPRREVFYMILILVILSGTYFIPSGKGHKTDPKLTELLIAQAEELEDYSEKIEEEDKYDDIEFKEELSQDLSELAEKLKTEDLTKKDSLLEFSEMENKLEDMKENLEDIEKSMKSLEEELSKDSGSEKSLSEELKELERKMSENGLSSEEKERLASKIEETAEKLSENNPLKEDLKNLAGALKEGKETGEQIKDLAKKMEKMSAEKEMLDEALSKMQKCQKEIAGQSGEELPEDLASMLSSGELSEDGFSKNPTKVPVKDVSEGDGQSDFGKGSTNEAEKGNPVENSPIIDRQSESESDKTEQFVKFYNEERLDFEKSSTGVSGEMGEGETEGSVPTTGAPTNIEKADKPYEEIYREYKNEAEKALTEEKIPKGYKNLIRKYFDEIDPSSIKEGENVKSDEN